jgi:uncharacterized protein
MPRANRHRLKPKLLTHFLQRARGLLGREGLLDQGGVLIQPCRSVHTFGMIRAIDVVFINAAGIVQEIRADVLPWRVVNCQEKISSATLEMRAGACRTYGIAVGDQITFL